ncbi:Sushi, von Willebrand factor type A, EGF and pentraxin domain-containing protein 1 [Gracilariopsis chorda]|uniref:Sushi, von Willebrand factor type A, EGF and pentraxin domain-containing protein 1 n=1 Tax=Gracilariopsis chorda TaxID=448386 RepID=A0A2V3IIJ9_9FLOR|nr:Sushi, von Willebrand factor type A, EGF and pentraxin domain-containing protein 1 [Gracilariopsis chorda]|eukprot:PXF41889.1 Sushi, von Willebrand factor type A, EGF and pentraxin domain-containing protein 1 [Gracilariopsis chorda]
MKLAFLSFSVLLTGCLAICPTGTFIFNNTCQPCAPGRFSDREDSNFCSFCPPGTFSETPGATSRAACLPCPRGTAAGTGAARSCTKCPAGSFSDAQGADSPTACQPCPKGTLSPAGSFRCYQCKAGRYADTIGSSFCTWCPKGTFSLGLVSRCALDVGLERLQISRDLRFASLALLESLVQFVTQHRLSNVWIAQLERSAPVAVRSAPGAMLGPLLIGKAPTLAHLARPGHLLQRRVPHQPRYVNHAHLEPSAYPELEVAVSAEKEHLQTNLVPVLRRLARAVQKEPLVDEVPADVIVADLVPSPTSRDQHPAEAAPPGHSAPPLQESRQTFACPVRRELSVEVVPTCAQSAVPGHSVIVSLQLSAGAVHLELSFSFDGATSCTNCGAGSYSDQMGSSSCTGCPAGTFGTIVGAQSASSCQPCPKGSASLGSSSTCNRCSTGSDTSSSCQPCPAGTFSAAGADRCTRCREGTFSDQPRSGSCSSCPAGTGAVCAFELGRAENPSAPRTSGRGLVYVIVLNAIAVVASVVVAELQPAQKDSSLCIASPKKKDC